ncbi:MAG TPA: glutathionylspermidine synthase family protein [Candidatus Binatia bacterium]|nr:glutathionylspermidine synthase family protein [Candidatus Binatia bacterium]
MKRCTITPRKDWREITQKQGLTYSRLPDGSDYWNESAYYALSKRDVETLDRATERLHNMCLAAGQYIIDNKRWRDLGIRGDVAPLIERTWIDEPPALYGRMDLAYNGNEEPKLLEYNADTPTALVEASVIQWYWLQDCFRRSDQFNSLHEKLVAKWRDLKNYVKAPVFFTHCDLEEDAMTVCYLRQTAEEAGIKTIGMLMSQLGYDAQQGCFVGFEGERAGTIFKLYPWEMMVKEMFWKNVLERFPEPQWIEPIWKMMWSNKALLAVLWEMYPNHENLLPAYLDGPREMVNFVKKPKLGREGANVSVYSSGIPVEETSGAYADSGWVYQATTASTKIGNKFAVIGSWEIADQGTAGIGIRESDHTIVGNTSAFVPHLIE